MNHFIPTVLIARLVLLLGYGAGLTTAHESSANYAFLSASVFFVTRMTARERCPQAITGRGSIAQLCFAGGLRLSSRRRYASAMT
jgi:hypothetical protein